MTLKLTANSDGLWWNIISIVIPQKMSSITHLNKREGKMIKYLSWCDANSNWCRLEFGKNLHKAGSDIIYDDAFSCTSHKKRLKFESSMQFFSPFVEICCLSL